MGEYIMILEKHFIFDRTLGLQCTNMGDVREYMQEKIAVLRDYENYKNKAITLGLLQEIIDMYEEDIQTPDVDMSQLQDMVYGDEVSISQMLMYFDFTTILGGIAYNIFDYDKNAIRFAIDGISGPISTSSMFITAYDELHMTKENGTHFAYGATLILVTILESELKKKFKGRFIAGKTREIEELISSETFIPTDEQRSLLDCLEEKRTEMAFNKVYATTQAAFDLFESAGVLDNRRDQKNLLLDKATLNQLLGYDFFIADVEPAFLHTMEYLFKTNNLNLRNDIAHGAFGYRNYYHLNVTSMLFYMCSLVIDDACWISECEDENQDVSV